MVLVSHVILLDHVIKGLFKELYGCKYFIVSHHPRETINETWENVCVGPSRNAYKKEKQKSKKSVKN